MYRVLVCTRFIPHNFASLLHISRKASTHSKLIAISCNYSTVKIARTGQKGRSSAAGSLPRPSGGPTLSGAGDLEGKSAELHGGEKRMDKGETVTWILPS